jgi:hypothetical protein
VQPLAIPPVKWSQLMAWTVCAKHGKYLTQFDKTNERDDFSTEHALFLGPQLEVAGSRYDRLSYRPEN